MHRVSVVLFVLALTISFNMAYATGEKNIIVSTLKSATIYRNGAELVHTARAAIEQGSSELIIGDISSSIDASSLRVSCTGNITIMSVAFSTEYLKPETASPFVRRLQDSVETIKKELTRLDVLIRSDQALLDVLAANKTIAGTNGLSVAELSKMMDYYRQKTIELNSEINGYREKSDKYKQLAEKLENQVREEEKKNSKTGGRLTLQLQSPMSGNVDFTVSYLTTAAAWTPFYDLKVDNVNDPLHILYKARIMQTTGLDWKKVKLTLSTSQPGQGGNAPVLKTWFLQFVDPLLQNRGVSSSAGYSNNFSNTLQGRVAGVDVKSQQLSEVVVRGAGRDQEKEANTEPLYIVNGNPVDKEAYSNIDPRAIKKIDVLKDAEATALYGSRAAAGAVVITLKDELGDYVSVNDNQMDVTFDIDLPYDVPANGKEQGVVLKEYKVPCAYQYYSAPRADKEAYLLGGISGWEKLNLLPGEANIIVEGANIGKSFIDPASTQDTLNLTLGRDKRVVVKKEKLMNYSSVKFLGSNKKQVFTYELTVRNNKKEKVQMLLKDQYPISSNKDIEEELLESSGAVVNTETGVLTWRTDLAPGETKKYRVSYSIKYPKDKILNIN
ncbi:MAG: mucoidy inhibitor MuiA family protein [Chitinophagaceae bacterium]|nr:mucoidy inhibitor MuiA family protein [Chitinophagaceae bacterium]